MLQCYNVTMLQCYNVTMLKRFNVKKLHCNNVYNVTMLQPFHNQYVCFLPILNILEVLLLTKKTQKFWNSQCDPPPLKCSVRIIKQDTQIT